MTVPFVALPGARRRIGPLGRLARVVLWVGRVITVAEERRRLAELDDRMLRDIGVDRATAHHEAARGWLDLPRTSCRRIR